MKFGNEQRANVTFDKIKIYFMLGKVYQKPKILQEFLSN